MDSKNCDGIQAALWRYVDRELPAKELSVVSGHLRECDDCLRLYEERAREVKIYRLALEETPFGESFVDRFRKRFAEYEHAPAGLAPRKGSRATERAGAGGRARAAGLRAAARPRRFQWVGLAAVLLVVPSLVFITVYSGTPDVVLLGSFRVKQSSVKYSRVGGRKSMLLSGSGSKLRPDSRFEVRRNGVLEIVLQEKGFPAVGRLELKGPAMLVIPSDATAQNFRAKLGVGTLDVRVEPRKSDESFEIRTPDAVTRVLGTAFRLEVRDRETRLEVKEGVVSLIPTRGSGDSSEREKRVGRKSGTYRVVARGERAELVGLPGREGPPSTLSSARDAAASSGSEGGRALPPTNDAGPAPESAKSAGDAGREASSPPAGSPGPDLDHPRTPQQRTEAPDTP